MKINRTLKKSEKSEINNFIGLIFPEAELMV